MSVGLCSPRLHTSVGTVAARTLAHQEVGGAGTPAHEALERRGPAIVGIERIADGACCLVLRCSFCTTQHCAREVATQGRDALHSVPLAAASLEFAVPQRWFLRKLKAGRCLDLASQVPLRL